MISKFTEIGIPEDIAKAMDDMGWEEPTPIQVNSVPLGLQGIDMFALPTSRSFGLNLKLNF